MRNNIKDELIDLIYLDPPFKSGASHNILYKEQDGSGSVSQMRAFEDTWEWDEVARNTYNELIVLNDYPKLITLIQGLYSFLGCSTMMSYLVMMAIRLIEMHRILKDTGSIYLHCDPTASHYLKLLLDAIFGTKNFQNEIIWAYKSGGATSKRFARKHDVLFFYSKNNKMFKFNPIKEKSYNRGLKPYYFKGVTEYKDDIGWYTMVNMKDVWQIDMVGRTSKERMGYPTQKPEKLLNCIILASSNKGDIVLDPFCGCGTTISVAEKFERRWIGIDITHIAIQVIKERLDKIFHCDLSPYEVIGDPEDLAGVKDLIKQDRHDYQRWALAKINASGNKIKGADGGIDGRKYFIDDTSGESKKMVVQVKSGSVTRSQIATLNSDRIRENAEIGIFLTMNKPTKPMREEAIKAGYYESKLYPGDKYPRIQIITIEELLDGELPRYPQIKHEPT